MPSSLLASSVNLINNVIGAGLFSMPWCLAQSTVVTGCVMFVLIGGMNLLSFGLLARCCLLTGKHSYLEIGELAFGPRFGIVAQATTTCYATGSLISYVVLASNFLLGSGTGVIALSSGPGTFFGDASLGARAVVCSGFSLIFFYPLCLLRRIDSLKLTSWAALLATLFAGWLCVFEWWTEPDAALTDEEREAAARHQLRSSVQWFGLPLSLWTAVPIVNVAFTAHYNAPRYFEELEARSVRRYLLMTSGALSVALVVYLTVGLAGYLSFGSHVKGDVLENFRGSYPFAVGARVALLVVLISCYPKVHFAVRDGVIRWLTRREHTTDTLPFPRLLGVTAVVVGLSVVFGVLCDSVEVVLAYKGAVFGSLMVYVLPSLMHTALVLQREADEVVQHEALLLPELHGKPRAYLRLGQVVWAMAASPLQHLGATILFVWGTVSGVLGVAVTIRKQLNGS